MSAFGALAPFAALGLSELKPLAAAPTETHRPVHVAHSLDLRRHRRRHRRGRRGRPGAVPDLRGGGARTAAQARRAAARLGAPADRAGARQRLHAHAAHAQGRRAPGRGDAPGGNGAPARNPDRTADGRRGGGRCRRRRGAAGPLRCDGPCLRRDAQPRCPGLCRRGRRGDRAAGAAPAPAVRRSCCRRRTAAAAPSPPSAAGRGAGASATPPSRRCRSSPKPRSPARAATRPRLEAAPAEAAAPSAAPSKPAPAAAAAPPSPALPPSCRRSTGRASPPAASAAPAKPVERAQVLAQSAVRVRAPLLDRLVNQAGEVSITRSRIESGVGQIKGSLVGPDREPGAPARPAARHRAAGRGADDLAARGRQGGVAGLRPARVRPLHPLPGADADDGRVGQRRRHGAAHAAALARAGRRRAGRPGAPDPRPAGRPAAHPHGGVRGPFGPPLPRRPPGRQGNRQAGPARHRRRLDRSGPRRAGPDDAAPSSTCCATASPTASSRPRRAAQAGKDPTGTIVVALSHEGNEVGVEFRDDGAGLDLRAHPRQGARRWA